MALGGRPEEEGGHKDWHLTFNKITTEALKKVREGGGKASEVLEKAFKPIAEKYDPGELSIHVWRYEVYLSQRIIKAAEEGKTDNVQGLAALANSVKDFRSLAKIPPLDAKLLSTDVTLFWEKQAFEDLIKIRNAVTHKDPDDYVLAPETTLRCIETYPKLIENMSPETTELENQIKWAYKVSIVNSYLRTLEIRSRLTTITNVTVPKILKKAFAILQEK